MKNKLSYFSFCPHCGSRHFVDNDWKSRRCMDCGFVYYLNPSAATAAFIVNDNDELLVVRRGLEPAKGTLDLPGGFCDIGETVEEGIIREVSEETGLRVSAPQYLFSLPNIYHYSGFDVPTLDFFFLCRVNSCEPVKASDDAAQASWIPISELEVSSFGLKSVSMAVARFIENKAKYLKK